MFTKQQHLEQKYDAVVMLRGLCLCRNDAFACGGLNMADDREVAGFLRQVISAVDWSRNGAFAFLDGQEFGRFYHHSDTMHARQKKNQSRALNRLARALKKLEDQYELAISMESRRNGKFRGILITKGL